MLRDYGTIAWKDGFRAWGDRGNGCCQILRHSWRLMPKIDATKSSKLVSMKWCESSKLSSILSFFGGGKQKYILKSDLNKKTTTPMSINWTWWYLMTRLALRRSKFGGSHYITDTSLTICLCAAKYINIKHLKCVEKGPKQFWDTLMSFLLFESFSLFLSLSMFGCVCKQATLSRLPCWTCH